MNREEAKKEILTRWREILPAITNPAKQRVNGETSYICPICGHGKGGDGLTKNPKSQTGYGLKCFGCDFSGDIISLYQQHTQKGFAEALNELAAILGIDIDPLRLDEPKNHHAGAAYKALNAEKDINVPLKIKTAEIGSDAPTKPNEDFTDYYRRCRGNINAPEAVEYLKSRGISLETAEKYWLGFDPEADPTQSGHPCARIIIPASPFFYTARRIDGNPNWRYLNSPSSREIFNWRVLDNKDVQEIFVTEGAFDALSLLEIGADAIALNSAANWKMLLEILEKKISENKRPTASFILWLDNDKAGDKAQMNLRQGLQQLGIPFVVADVSGKCKDPNEALVNDRKMFEEAVSCAILQTTKKPDNTRDYIDLLMNRDIKDFGKGTSTGFENLDKQSDGLYSGLYVLAAISSLGKTSFALQLADQLAERGNDVMYFGIEQSKLELVSRSLARAAAKDGAKINSLSIRKGYHEQEVQEAAQKYKAAVSDRMTIIQGNFGSSITTVIRDIKNYIETNGVKPIVFIDYLQILQPDKEDERKGHREAIDGIVSKLKQFSSNYNLTIFLISSVNRMNYTTLFDYESLKESGGIEFTADVILGMQLQCLHEELFTKEGRVNQKRARINAAKKENPRKIELVCLKNRFGISNFSCWFDYYPAHDLFVEAQEPDPDFVTIEEDVVWERIV